jgi:hypothetical protein
MYTRAGLLFVANLHPSNDWLNVPMPAGRYNLLLDTDEGWYGGRGRLCRYLDTATSTVST